MCRACGNGAPWCPSFMAVVDRAERPEFGVPLLYADYHPAQVS